MLAACVLLGGCAARGPLIDSSRPLVELEGTPFFPQTAHQCGPAALATVLGASQVSVTPEQLEPEVYLPGRRGSLQVEMQAAPRRHGRLSYRVEPELSAILAEVDGGRPVLVLHNYGLPVWPRWHYAVVVGYDGQHGRIVLRSGKTRRQTLSVANFMRAWDNGDRWALVMLKPGELPAAPDKERYLEAAAAFERGAAPRDAWAAFDAAVRTWPQDAVALVGRGTANYASQQRQAAAEDYAAALQLEPANPAAANNLAMTLLEMGCPQGAARALRRLDSTALSAVLQEAVTDTRRQVDAQLDKTENAGCPHP